jgi:hypothetical protein
MVSRQVPKGTWTRERVAAEAKKHSRKIDFMRANASAYVTAYRNGWLADACKHMGNG